METNLERASALALLDRGVGFTIPAPFFYRIFGRKNMKISVKRLRLGTLLHLSTLNVFGQWEKVEVGEAREKIISEMRSDPHSLPLKIIIENIKPVTLAVAACLLNSPLKIMLFAPVLARHLRRNCTADQLQELLMWIFIYGRVESFRNITNLIERMKMTKPMNLGQD